MDTKEKAVFCLLSPIKPEKLKPLQNYPATLTEGGWDHMAPTHLEHHPWKLHTVGIQTGSPWESCAAEDQGKADRDRRSAPSQIISALPTLQ